MTDARRELIFGALGVAIMAVVAVVLVMQTSDGLPGFGSEPDDTSTSPGTLPPPMLSPTPTTTPTPTATATPTPIPQTYTVQSGDTLRVIAGRFDVTVEHLAAKNGILDPNNIFAGQKLELPQPGERIDTTVIDNRGDAIYIVKTGDTLFGIAQELGLTVDSLAEANDSIDPSQLFVGRPLTIPDR